MLQCIGVSPSATARALVAGILRKVSRGETDGKGGRRAHEYALDAMSKLYSTLRDLLVAPGGGGEDGHDDSGLSFDYAQVLARLNMYEGVWTGNLHETLRTAQWVWVPDHPRMMAVSEHVRPSRKLPGALALRGSFFRPAECVWDEPSKTMDSMNQTVSDEVCRECTEAGMPRVLSRYYGESMLRDLFVHLGGVAEKPSMGEYIALMVHVAAAHKTPNASSATIVFRTLCNFSYSAEWCEVDEDEDVREDGGASETVEGTGASAGQRQRFRNLSEYTAALREGLRGAGKVLVGRSAFGQGIEWVGLDDGCIFVDDSSSGMLTTSFGQIVDVSRSVSSSAGGQQRLDLLATSSAWVKGISGFIKDLNVNLDRLYCDVLGIHRLSSALAERLSDASAEGAVPVSLGCSPEAVAVVYFLQAWSASALDAEARDTLRERLSALSLTFVDRIIPAVRLDSPGCTDFADHFATVPCLLDSQRHLLAVDLNGGDLGALIAHQIAVKLIPHSRSLSRDAERHVCAALGILASSPADVLLDADGWEARLNTVAIRLGGVHGGEGESSSQVENAFSGGLWVQPAELEAEMGDRLQREAGEEVDKLTHLMRAAMGLSKKRGKSTAMGGSLATEGGLTSALSGLHSERKRFREERVRILESGGDPEAFAAQQGLKSHTAGRGMAGGDHGPAVGGYLGPLPGTMSGAMEEVAKALLARGRHEQINPADVHPGTHVPGAPSQFQRAGDFSVDYEDVPLTAGAGEEEEEAFGLKVAAKLKAAGLSPSAVGTGRWGEAFVTHLLEQASVPGASVLWVNRDQETGMPYDIALEGIAGERIFVEVKTTRLPEGLARPSSHERDLFELSLAELDFARVQGERYLLYRVFLASNGATTVRRFRDPVGSFRPGGLGLLMVA